MKLWSRNLGALGLLAALGLALARPAAAQHAEPMQIRNLNPLVAIFGLPAWDVVGPGNRFSSSLDIANHYRLSQRGGDLLILDGETWRTTLAFSHGFDSGWSIGAEVPLLHIGGGVLDDLIDGWHSTFDMPDGGRNSRPEGQLLFLLGDQNGRFFRLDDPQSGLGDIQLKAAHAFGADRGFIVQAAVKLATGDETMLAGSGSTDWSLTLLRSRPLPARKHPSGYFWGIGVIRSGEPVEIDFDHETSVYTAVVGGSWQPWRRFGLKAQLDYHGAFYDSQLEEIGEGAIEATFGAWMQRRERSWLEFAVVEDLEVSTAPDVVVRVAAHWSW
jgi:hypothetical protein